MAKFIVSFSLEADKLIRCIYEMMFYSWIVLTKYTLLGDIRNLMKYCMLLELVKLHLIVKKKLWMKYGVKNKATKNMQSVFTCLFYKTRPLFFLQKLYVSSWIKLDISFVTRRPKLSSTTQPLENCFNYFLPYLKLWYVSL